MTASAAATGSKTTAAYANAATATNPTGNHQPSSSSDTQGNATADTYNGAGSTPSSKDVRAADAKVEYNSDGTVKSRPTRPTAPTPRASKLDPFMPIVKETLRIDVEAPRKQRHTIKRICDRVTSWMPAESGLVGVVFVAVFGQCDPVVA